MPRSRFAFGGDGGRSQPLPDGKGSVALLVASDVSKAFRGRTVLDHVSLSVDRGQCVVIVGENGTGKSTLLRICAGLLSSDEGVIMTRGALGYCPQDPGLFDLLTADEHLILFGRCRGLSRTAALERGRRVLGALGFAGHERTQARSLSGGARQKLNLALAVIGNPEILLLDEPYQGFDHGSYLNFWDHVDGWKSDGRAVLVVTHMLTETSRVDQLVELRSPMARSRR